MSTAVLEPVAPAGLPMRRRCVMAARYRLPDILGGGECTIVAGCTEGCADDVQVDVAGYLITVPLAALTKVAPPLPPEPPLWAVVIDKHERAWQHVNDGRGDWTCTVADLGADWEELQEHAPLTRLVPDPAAGVELPWHTDAPDSLLVALHSRLKEEPRIELALWVHAREAGRYLFASEARAVAGALWAAADAAEAGAP